MEGDEHYVGAAYIFRREGGTWVEEQKLIDEQGKALLDAFGFPFRKQQAGV